MLFLHRRLVVCFAGLLVGCSTHTRPAVMPGLPPPAPDAAPLTAVAAPPVQLPPDPIATLISRAEAEFEAGRAEQQAGRLLTARSHFDRAVDLLLEQPDGARSSPRLSNELDQLLDRISALDILALRESDGVAESQSEPAAIDELLGAAIFERPKPALTTEETVRADLERTPHDVDIPANERVLSYVELFQGRLHDFMEAGLERGLRYLPMIQRVFAAEGLPLDLSYVPLVESAFKPTALSRASARGMWQFMAPTAKANGLEQDWFIDERADPEKATHAAADYFKTLRDMFDGDWNLALASYNAGPGRVQRAIARARTDDYWRLAASTRYLPRDTREYVPMIMAAMIIGANPGLYGFEVGSAQPLAYERVTVPNALDLKVIAEWINCSVDELRELNP
jgi:membrane-bound lytic murein transglycosylase D